MQRHQSETITVYNDERLKEALFFGGGGVIQILLRIMSFHTTLGKHVEKIYWEY